ncbi:MAG: Ig-like domain-containing protein, partial [Phycisphaerales bacterium]
AEIFWFSPDYSILMWIGDTPTYPFDDPDAAPEFASKRYDFRADFFAGFSWFPIFNDEPGASNAFRDVWSETRSYSGYSRDMDLQASNQLNEPRNNEPFRSDDFRITFGSNSADTLIEESELYGDLYDFRVIARDALLLELIDDDSDLAIAARALDRAEAILDAYVTIGMPDELSASDVLRSALRALPGTSELGLGSIDVITMIDELSMGDHDSGFADQELNVTRIDEILNERIDLVHEEILRGLDRPAVAPDYVAWVQRELGHVRDTAFDLARDDMYVAGPSGTVVTDVFDGVLVNDVDQEFRTITLDTAYFLDPGYVEPSNGTVLLNADGSFTYEADPGFSGMDSFTYRSMTTIAGVAEPVYSNPATVVIQIPSAGCGLADFNADGELNFFDVSAFLVAYQNEDAQADLNDDGLFNFFDVSAFLTAYGAGCP